MKKLLLLLGTAVLSISACTKTVYVAENKQVFDGQYDSEFPRVSTSAHIEEINKSVKLVNAMANYHGYVLPANARIVRRQISEPLLKQRAEKSTYFNSPASGTATLIYSDSRRAALLTCAHIVEYPDTIVTFRRDSEGRESRFVHSVYFKKRQSITVTGLAEVSDYKILAIDKKRDIAVIGKKYNKPDLQFPKPFSFSAGKASELQAGTFVYLFGFPRGERMTATGIVGRANKDSEHTFILDAPMHNGISGGLVVAIRDGVPNFELVGMVFAVAGQSMSFLGPEKETPAADLAVQQPYEGPIYLNSVRQIVYGITYGVSMEAITGFLDRNTSAFEEHGFNRALFFKPVKPQSL